MLSKLKSRNHFLLKQKKFSYISLTPEAFAFAFLEIYTIHWKIHVKRHCNHFTIVDANVFTKLRLNATFNLGNRKFIAFELSEQYLSKNVFNPDIP